MSKTRPDWDTYFLDIARAVATRADCRRRAVGAVIVDAEHRIVSTGYNGAPRGVPGCLEGHCPRGLLSYEEIQASSNYDSGPGRCISLHAEANALIYAGKQVRDCAIYITDEPCPTCAKLIAGAGIEKVVVEYRDFDTLAFYKINKAYPITFGNIDFHEEVYNKPPECGSFNTKLGYRCTQPDGHSEITHRSSKSPGEYWV